LTAYPVEEQENTWGSDRTGDVTNGGAAMQTNQGTQYGAKEVASQLHQGLMRYLEAQYHIRDTGIIEERHALLQEAGTIGQRPYIETTPSYQVGNTYAHLGLPSPIGETLTELAQWKPGIGIFPNLYLHQVEALQTFFHDESDLIVSTGTGSGKTETFLLPIVGQLLLEGASRPDSFRLPGCRALLLYPMNALVSDQIARLRRLFGDERLRDIFVQRYGRSPLFGMYTSRTPYPGSRTAEKDRQYLHPLLQYYLELKYPDPQLSMEEKASRARLVQELWSRGRWPAKDLQGFYGTEGRQWRQRLQTQPGDRELLTRHEMQLHSPDILVTNYSMLEYMLLRPIERSLFQQTREWLAQDERNTLILVLDEAHMYRGTSGAEIALLIRRLQARLGITRERMRCILTSASLGSGSEAERQMKAFALGLTGRPQNHKMPFRLVQGQREFYVQKREGTTSEAAILAAFDLGAFYQHAEDLTGAVQAVVELGKKLHWPSFSLPLHNTTDGSEKENAENALKHYLYQCLLSFGPLQLLIEKTAGSVHPFEDLVSSLFPTAERNVAELATTVLLALGSYAHNGERTLLPSRVHLFFRGLPSLYACINPCCEHRRYRPGERLLLGRLYTEPRTHCTCSMQSRVYELYTHRDCGVAFLRVFGRGKQAEFYWHEQGGSIEHVGEPLDECLLLVEQPHRDMVEHLEPVWIDISTGRVQTDPPGDQKQYRQLWRPLTKGTEQKRFGKKKRQTTKKFEGEDRDSQEMPLFRSCPVCTKRSTQKIMNLETKGEQPFANLVRDLFVLQPAVKETNDHYPNGGRKVLLFSDGRQKAARLARDLPREVEFDSFRQALVLSVQRLVDLGYEATLDERLYLAFVSVCHDFHLYFFDRKNRSQEQLLDDIRRYRHFYDADLQTALEENNWRDIFPYQYRLALLRQLVDPYYSLYAACAAVARPSKASLRYLKRKLSSLPASFYQEQLESVAMAWIQALLERTAFDPSINEEARREIDEYFRPFAPDEPIRRIERLLISSGALDEMQTRLLRTQLYEVLTRSDQTNGHIYLQPSAIALVLAINDTWVQCVACGLIQHRPVLNSCVYCGRSELEQRSPDHPYMVSRKGFFREPLQAVLAGSGPIHITVEEHTAQLSQRDAGTVYATTEEYELRFQDVPLDQNKSPVDILSCTTTMEVGIDIGSLTAVGLRNVPPQRENYQQRAGRAGRRGSSLSTVLTYAQGGPHDNYYYERPAAIISGRPREPKVKIDNRRLARRHIHSFLIQTFFHEQL
jgi:Lhr-like helicase